MCVVLSTHWMRSEDSSRTMTTHHSGATHPTRVPVVVVEEEVDEKGRVGCDEERGVGARQNAIHIDGTAFYASTVVNGTQWLHRRGSHPERSGEEVNRRSVLTVDVNSQYVVPCLVVKAGTHCARAFEWCEGEGCWSYPPTQAAWGAWCSSLGRSRRTTAA